MNNERGNEHGKLMGLLNMPSVKKLHYCYMSGSSVVAVLSETHNKQTSGVYRVDLDADEVATALWRIAAARVARSAG